MPAAAAKPTGTTDPEGKLRLERFFGAYKAYVLKHRKGPADEAALREFIAALPTDEKNNLKIGDDLDALFTSPRDGQKYEVRYGIALTMAARPRPSPGKQKGQNGKRYVALNVGYVQEYSEQDFNELKRK